MPKKRILLITPLPPPIHGSTMMSQYIKDSRIINEAFDCDFINLSTSRRIDEIGKMSWRKIFRFFSSYFILIGKLLRHRYHLCYLAITCHGIGFLKDFPFILICKMFKRKVVLHQHNKGMVADVNRWPYRWLLPLAYKKVKVILLSMTLYEDISKVVTENQTMVCPNGIPEETHKIKIASHAIPCILFLSNLLINKGVLTLLDACGILKNKGEKFICRFVGGETQEIDRRTFKM